jgi:hypothetical protein
MLIARCKLLRVTAGTRQMTGKFRSRRIIVTLVAEQARQTRVHWIGMLKSGKILTGFDDGFKRCFNRLDRIIFNSLFGFGAKDQRAAENQKPGGKDGKLHPAP